MKYYKTIFTFLSFLLNLIAYTQNNLLVFQPVNNSVLLQYNIRSVSTDAEGKLWLCTDNGLLCYDGNDVKIFKHSDDPYTISSDNISHVYPDNKGNLYIINDVHENNLSFMNGKTGKFSIVNVQHEAEDFRMMATPFAYSDLLIDDDSSIWLAGYYIGFVHLNLTNQKTDLYYFQPKHSGKNTVYTIKKDAGNKELLWLGTENGIYSFNKKTKELKRDFKCKNSFDSTAADLQILSLDSYNSDSIWFSTAGKGIGFYNTRTGYYTIYPPTAHYFKANPDAVSIQIRRKSQTEYFVFAKNELPQIFNIYTHTYSIAATTSQNLPSVLVNDFLFDHANNFWCILYNRLFQAHSTQNKFETVNINGFRNTLNAENAFKKIVWDEKNAVYYAAFDKGETVFVLDINLKPIKAIPIVRTNTANTTSTDKINDLFFDNKGSLWVCGSSLYVYDKISQKIVVADTKYPSLLLKTQNFQNGVVKNDNIYLQPSDFFCRAIYCINANTLAADSIILPDEISKDKNYEPQPVKLLDFLVIDKAGVNAYFGYSKYNVMGYVDCLLQFNLKTKEIRRVTFIRNVEHNEGSNLFKYGVDDSDRIWSETEEGIMIYDPVNLRLIKKIGVNEEHFSVQLQNIPGTNVMCRLYSRGLMLYDYKNNNQVHLSLNDGLISYSNSAISFANQNLFVGGANYIQSIPIDNIVGKKFVNRKCYLSSIELFNQDFKTDTLPQYLHHLTLPYNKNFITLSFASTEFEKPERLEYRYKMDDVDPDWVYVNHLNRTISYNDLSPGKYLFHAAVKNNDGRWSDDAVNLSVNIIPAWWQTNLFKVALAVSIVALLYLLVRWRIHAVRTHEQLKVRYEKELLELEAKALRAQMNPHFIFNCMNSIKSLIQKNEQEKAITYLTIFSKLIRTVFQNSDKREITLFNEIETCRLYTQMESMRFDNKFDYRFNIDPTLDLKSIMVPALIIQPFIENAIWHGIMPKQDGGMVSVTVDKTDHTIHCIIDDNGIGRDISKQNKFYAKDGSHESKGEHLTQARLDLDNLLNERSAKIEIIDKKNENNISVGTTVIVSFNEY